jgi:hypothetical protein
VCCGYERNEWLLFLFISFIFLKQPQQQKKINILIHCITCDEIFTIKEFLCHFLGQCADTNRKNKKIKQKRRNIKVNNIKIVSFLFLLYFFLSLKWDRIEKKGSSCIYFTFFIRGVSLPYCHPFLFLMLSEQEFNR